MKTFARLIGDVVAETVAIKDDQKITELFHPDLKFVPCPETVQQGWTLSGKTWKTPVVPLDTLKALKLAKVQDHVAEILAAGFYHNFGSTAGVRILDQRGVGDDTAWLMVERTASKMEPDEPFPIRDARNGTFVTTAGTAAAAMDAMAAWRFAISQNAWRLKDAVDAAGTAAALDSVDTGAGWPV